MRSCTIVSLVPHSANYEVFNMSCACWILNKFSSAILLVFAGGSIISGINYASREQRIHKRVKATKQKLAQIIAQPEETLIPDWRKKSLAQIIAHLIPECTPFSAPSLQAAINCNTKKYHSALFAFGYGTLNKTDGLCMYISFVYETECLLKRKTQFFIYWEEKNLRKTQYSFIGKRQTHIPLYLKTCYHYPLPSDLLFRAF